MCLYVLIDSFVPERSGNDLAPIKFPDPTFKINVVRSTRQILFIPVTFSVCE